MAAAFSYPVHIIYLNRLCLLRPNAIQHRCNKPHPIRITNTKSALYSHITWFRVVIASFRHKEYLTPQLCISQVFHEPECRNFRLEWCYRIIRIRLSKTLFHSRFNIIYLRKYLFLDRSVTIKSNTTYYFIIILNVSRWILLNRVIPISTSLCIHILRNRIRSLNALLCPRWDSRPWWFFIIKDCIGALGALQVIKACAAGACSWTLSASLHSLCKGFCHVAIIVHYLLIFFIYTIFKPLFIIFHRTDLKYT